MRSWRGRREGLRGVGRARGVREPGRVKAMVKRREEDVGGGAAERNRGRHGGIRRRFGGSSVQR